MKTIRHLTAAFSIILAAACAPKETDLDLGAMIQPIPETACLQDPDYFIWGGSMVKDDAGTYHIFYSRWKKEYSFESWVTHSEIAHATSKSSSGPFVHKDVALPIRGAEYWDGLCTHNPTVHKFGDKYYLYYMGNTGDGQAHFDDNGKLIFNYGHRNNQRIGVAVADDPNGPWTRFDKPLIDITPDDDADDALMTSNPAITECPDGSYMMAYKAVAKKRELPFGGPVITLMATSESPVGPFKKLMKPAFTIEGVDFACEDSFVWSQGGKYYALVSDYRGYFLGHEREFPMFESTDGANWALARHPLVRGGHELLWEGGRTEYYERLERPQLFFENGRPAVLLMAVQKKDENGRLSSYNVQIPLK